MKTKAEGSTARAIVLMLVVMGLAFGATGAVAAPYESYNERWNLPLQADDDMTVDLSAVDVIVKKYEQAELSVAFEGRRASASDGTMPFVSAERKDGQIIIRTIWPKQGIVNFNNGKLEGTLTILVPDTMLSGVSLTTFSGGISIDDQAMEALSMETSSGDVVAKNLDVSGNLSVRTFSGTHALEAIHAGDITLEGSSGAITASALRAGGALNAETFSGDQSFTDSTANDIYMNASSGSITGNNVKAAGDITLVTFSGDIMANGVDVDTFAANTSSGDCDAVFIGHAEVAVETYSGDVRLSFPAGVGIAYQFDTFSGMATIDAPDAGTQQVDGKSVTGTIGDAAASVAVNTSSGALDLSVTE